MQEDIEVEIEELFEATLKEEMENAGVGQLPKVLE